MDLLPDTPWGRVGAVLLLIVGAISVKIGFTFDINQWQESKRKRRKERLQAKCPHAVPIKEGGRFGLESSFVSPLICVVLRVCWRGTSITQTSTSNRRRHLIRFTRNCMDE